MFYCMFYCSGDRSLTAGQAGLCYRTIKSCDTLAVSGGRQCWPSL